MSFDLQFLRDRAPATIAMVREHSIYLNAQRSDRKVQKARNIADVLERGHRVRSGQHTALVVDLKA